LPHYFNADLQLPEEAKFDVGFGDILWGIFTWHVELYNINYDNAIWDFQDMTLNMTRDLVTDLAML